MDNLTVALAGVRFPLDPETGEHTTIAAQARQGLLGRVRALHAILGDQTAIDFTLE